MIKPKSRKHEDRIKALEREVDYMQSELVTLHEQLEAHFFAHREIKRVCYARKWWKFWA